MEHIINRIIEIELSAQELIKNAKKEQTELPKKISETLEAKRAEYEKRAAARIEDIKAQEAAYADERIKEITTQHDQKLALLKKTTDEHISSWVEDIYNFIIKPTEL